MTSFSADNNVEKQDLIGLLDSWFKYIPWFVNEQM